MPPVPRVSPGGKSLPQGTRPSSVLLIEGRPAALLSPDGAPGGHVLLFLLRRLFMLRVAAGWFMAGEDRNGEGAGAAHSPSCECWSASGGRWVEAPGGAGLIPVVPLPSCLWGLASSTGCALHKAKVASVF